MREEERGRRDGVREEERGRRDGVREEERGGSSGRSRICGGGVAAFWCTN